MNFWNFAKPKSETLKKSTSLFQQACLSIGRSCLVTNQLGRTKKMLLTKVVTHTSVMKKIHFGPALKRFFLSYEKFFPFTWQNFCHLQIWNFFAICKYEKNIFSIWAKNESFFWIKGMIWMFQLNVCNKSITFWHIDQLRSLVSSIFSPNWKKKSYLQMAKILPFQMEKTFHVIEKTSSGVSGAPLGSLVSESNFQTAEATKKFY